MSVMEWMRRLTANDLRLMTRDPLLRGMALLPLLGGALVRWGLPVVRGLLEPRWERAPVFLDVVACTLLLLSPIALGVIVGFLLLDERDENTLTALRVTPLPTGVYVLYRVAMPTVLSAVGILVAIAISGVLPRLPPTGWLLVACLAIVAALEGPMMGLFLASFAENKVQGLALMKVLGMAWAIPVGLHAVSGPWFMLSGLLPPFWPMKGLWLLLQGAPGAWLHALVGLVIHGAVLQLLALRLRNAIAH